MIPLSSKGLCEAEIITPAENPPVRARYATPGVVTTWTGSAPRPLGSSVLGSVQLFQVSVFLAAFSGLYFTVYAVTDQLYREQFFTNVSDELERAVSVRAVYLALRGRRTTQQPG